MDTCKKIEVIETTLLRRGSGQSSEDPVRIIRQYWSLDGKLLAEVDTWKESGKILASECESFIANRVN